MNTPSTIMVQIADREWTLEALHAACVLGRKTNAQIVLVYMLPVHNVRFLGTTWGNLNFTPEQQDDFADYQTTVEDYGLDYTPVVFQYATWVEGTLQAAEYVKADIVFAPEPHAQLKLWRQFQAWMMKHQFVEQGREWITMPVYADELEMAITSLQPAPTH